MHSVYDTYLVNGTDRLSGNNAKYRTQKSCTFLFRSEKELRMDFNFFCCMYFLELFYLFWRFNAKLHSSCRRQFSAAQHWKFICADVRFWKASIYPLSITISFFLCIWEVRCFFLQLHLECWFGEESCSSLPSTLLQYYDSRWQCTSLDAIARTKTLKVTNKSVKTAQTGWGNIWPTIRCFSIRAIADTKPSQIDRLIVYLYHFHSSRRHWNKFWINRNDNNQSVTIHNFVTTCLITFFETTFESKPFFSNVHLQYQRSSN